MRDFKNSNMFQIGALTSNPLGMLAFTAMAILLRIGICNKVQATAGLALTTVSMACRIMLLTLGIAVLLTFPRFVLLSIRILGII